MDDMVGYVYSLQLLFPGNVIGIRELPFLGEGIAGLREMNKCDSVTLSLPLWKQTLQKPSSISGCKLREVDPLRGEEAVDVKCSP